jgi:hypothetical protein
MMKARTVLSVALLGILLASCQSARSSDRHERPTGRVGPSAAKSESQDSVGRPTELGFRSAESVTSAGISILTNHIDEFARTHRRIPVNLDELRSDLDPGSNPAWLDGWREPILYASTREEYELRSKGEDRLPKTDDDIVFVGTVAGPCYIRGRDGRTIDLRRNGVSCRRFAGDGASSSPN